MEGSLCIDGVDDEVDVGDAVPSGMKGATAVRNAAGPDTTLEGDGNPLVVEQGPEESKEFTLWHLDPLVPDKESKPSIGSPATLPPLVILS